MDVDARLSALEAENERLRDENTLLKAAFGMSFAAPIELGLTGQETKLFGALLARPMLTKDGALDVLYQGRDEAEIKIVDVFVCKMRKKLKPYGLSIETIWGRGYQISQDVRLAFKERWPDHYSLAVTV